MSNISKQNLKSLAAAGGLLILILCLLNYAAAPQSAGFLEAINPLEPLVGMAFVLTYFGLPIAMAVIVEVILILLILYCLFKLAKHIVK